MTMHNIGVSIQIRSLCYFVFFCAFMICSLRPVGCDDNLSVYTSATPSSASLSVNDRENDILDNHVSYQKDEREKQADYLSIAGAGSEKHRRSDDRHVFSPFTVRDSVSPHSQREVAAQGNLLYSSGGSKKDKAYTQLPTVPLPASPLPHSFTGKDGVRLVINEQREKQGANYPAIPSSGFFSSADTPVAVDTPVAEISAINTVPALKKKEKSPQETFFLNKYKKPLMMLAGLAWYSFVAWLWSKKLNSTGKGSLMWPLINLRRAKRLFIGKHYGRAAGLMIGILPLLPVAVLGITGLAKGAKSLYEKLKKKINRKTG